ncbi:hypothetical protein PO909_003022 [Leuciscus waleckii]
MLLLYCCKVEGIDSTSLTQDLHSLTCTGLEVLQRYRPFDEQLSHNFDDRNAYILPSFILKVNI